MATQIIQDHPGYFWQYDAEMAQWQMYWNPVNNWYSPPHLHRDIVKYEMDVPVWFQDKIGLLIGRQGQNFIKITSETGCYYIYYISVSNKIEVWGHQGNCIHAMKRIHKLMDYLYHSVTIEGENKQ